MKFSISPSQLGIWSCRLAWYWSHPLGYQPIKKAPALELGEGVHYALEIYYSKGIHPVKIFTKWADKMIAATPVAMADDIRSRLEARTLGIAMLEGYYKEYHGKEPFRVLEMDMEPSTEHTFSRPLPSPSGKRTNCLVTVRVDAIVEHLEYHKLFVLEHKTFSRFEPGHLFRDHQFAAQSWVAEQIAGRPLAGVIYNGLRKQVPGPRVRLKLFERIPVYVNRHQQRVFLIRAYYAYKKMNQPHLAIFPEPDMMRCNSCAYKQPCIEYMRGGDYKFILRNLFEKRPRPVVRSMSVG